MTRTRHRLLACILVCLLGIGLFAGASGVSAQESASTDTDLLIEQPTHIESEVDIQQEGNGTVYKVNGQIQRIWLQDIPHENVSTWGISEGSGDLAYQEQQNYWRFQPDAAGTMTLYWTVEDGNGTERHEARVRVDTTEYVHRTAKEDERVQAAANNWTELEDEVESNFPDRDTDEVVSAALTKEIFFASPFSSFWSDIQGAIIILTLTPGGLFILGILLFGFLASTYGLYKAYARLQRQTRDEHELEREKWEVKKDKTEKIAQQTDFNERLPDDTSQSVRKMAGENPWLASKRIMQTWSPAQVKGFVLTLMGQVGYRAAYRSDDGEITSAWILGPDEEAAEEDDVEVVELDGLDNGDERDRQLIDAIPGEQLELSVFDEPQRLDLRQVSLPIDNRDVSDAELIEEFEPQFPEDFRDEEHMAEALAEVFELIATHTAYTTEDGHIDEAMDLLNFNAEIATTLADEADFPPAHTYKRVFALVAEHLDSEAKLDEQVTKFRDEGLGGD